MQEENEIDFLNYSFCSADGCFKKIFKINSIQCQLCDGWFHLACTDLNKELFDALKQVNNKSLLWLCINCLKIWTNKSKFKIKAIVSDLRSTSKNEKKDTDENELHNFKDCNDKEESAKCSSIRHTQECTRHICEKANRNNVSSSLHSSKEKKQHYISSSFNSSPIINDEDVILSFKRWFVAHKLILKDDTSLDECLSNINKSSLASLVSCCVPFTCGLELLTCLSAEVSLCLLENIPQLEDEEEVALRNSSCRTVRYFDDSDDNGVQSMSRSDQLDKKSRSDYSSDSSSFSMRLSSLSRSNTTSVRCADFLVDKWDRRGALKYVSSSHDSDDNFIVSDIDVEERARNSKKRRRRKECVVEKAPSRTSSVSSVEQSSLINESDQEDVVRRGSCRSKKFRFDDVLEVNESTNLVKNVSDDDVSDNEIADLAACAGESTVTSDESTASDGAQIVLKKKRCRLSSAQRSERSKRQLQKKLVKLRSCRQRGECVKLIEITPQQLEEDVEEEDDDDADFIVPDGGDEECADNEEVELDGVDAVETENWWQIEISHADLCSRYPNENFQIVLTAYLKWAARISSNTLNATSTTPPNTPIPTPQSYAEAVAFRWLDRELDQYRQMIRSRALTKDFLTMLETFPGFSNQLHSYRTECEACRLKHSRTTQQITFDGLPYHADTLQEESHRLPDLPQPRTFFVGRVCASRSFHYHRLLHYRWTLLFVICPSRLNQEIVRLRNSSTRLTQDDSIVNRAIQACLQDEGWTSQLFREFESIDVYEKFMKNYFMND